MALYKEMSVSDFRTNLTEHFKEDGELNVDSRVDTLVRSIVEQNKENRAKD